MGLAELEATAEALVAEGKGILAADESDGTIKKRFDSIGAESTEENRRAYRELLFTTEGAEEYISGVILFDETIRQSSADGTAFPKLLESKGIIPGIQVDKGAKATGRVLQAVYTELHDQRIELRGTLLKPNMVLSGYDASDRAGVDEVADATLECFYKHVPAAVPGIVFLSGGQTDEDATAHLNAMNARGPHPWQLSFSYGRALQSPALKAWAGNPENVEAAQQAFFHRAKMNGAARTRIYAPEMEREAAAAV